MLVKFDVICKDNGLSYWLHGGTLLGSVRDKNFIEWDDDADVVMSRESFDKIRSLREELSVEGYHVEFPEDSNSFFDFIPGFYCDKYLVDFKFLDLKGKVQYFRTHPKIDLFVLDECKNDISHKIARMRLMSKYMLARGHRQNKIKLDLRVNAVLRPFLSFIAKTYEVIGSHKDYQKILGDYDRISRKNDGCGCRSVFLSNDQPWFMYRVYSKEVFNGSLDSEIGNHVFPIPKGFEDILVESYGDYSVKPPENQRIPSHYLLK